MRASLAFAAFVVSFAVPAAARAGDGVAILPLVAADAEVVAVLDVADARDAKMFEAGLALMLERASDMEAMLAVVDIKLRDVNTLLIAGGYGSSGSMSDISEDLMAVIEGGFNKKQVIKKLDALPNVVVKTKRKIKFWVTTDTEVALIGKRLVVTAPGGMAGVIDRSRKKAKGLTKGAKGAALRTALAYTNTAHDAWMISRPPSGLAGTMKSQLGGDLVSFSIGSTLATDMALEVKIQVGSAQQATDMVATLTPQLAGLKKMAGKFGLNGLASSLTMSSGGDLIDMDSTLTSSELSTLLGLMSMVDP